jgi:hypothetical protein
MIERSIHPFRQRPGADSAGHPFRPGGVMLLSTKFFRIGWRQGDRANTFIASDSRSRPFGAPSNPGPLVRLNGCDEEMLNLFA